MLREAVRDAWGVLNGAGKVAAASVARQSHDAQHMWQTSSVKHGAASSAPHEHQPYYSSNRTNASPIKQIYEDPSPNVLTDAASRVNALAQGAFHLAGAQLRKSVPPPLKDFAGMILPERSLLNKISSSNTVSGKLSLKERNEGVDDIISSADISAKQTAAAAASSSYSKTVATTAPPTPTVRVVPQTVEAIAQDYVKNIGRLRSVMHSVTEREAHDQTDGVWSDAKLAALTTHMPSISASIRPPPPGTVPSPGPMGPTSLPGDTGPIDMPGGSRVPPLPSGPRPRRSPESEEPRPHDAPLPPNPQQRPPAPGRQYPIDDPGASPRTPEREPGDIGQPPSYKLKPSPASTFAMNASSMMTPTQRVTTKSKLSDVYGTTASSQSARNSAPELSFKIPVQPSSSSVDRNSGMRKEWSSVLASQAIISKRNVKYY